MKATVKKAYRVGDLVKVVTPEVFITVRYDWDVHYGLEDVLSPEVKNQVNQFLVEMGIDSTSNEHKAVFRAVSLNFLKKNIVKSNMRYLVTEVKPEIGGLLCVVEKKRVVRTGQYVTKSMGEWDKRDFPHLINVKSHVILTVNPRIPRNQTDVKVFNIKSCHVSIYDCDSLV